MKNFWKNKKVVVTGAGGFIGSHAIETLVENGAKITAIVSPKTTSKQVSKAFRKYAKKVKVVKANLLLLEDCLRITKGQEIVLNFAAMDGGSRFKLDHSAEIFSANTRIILNMLDASVANKVDRFLLLSSVEVYPKTAKTPIKENTAWDFSEDTNGYVWSKRFSEIIAKMYAKNYGLKIAIARPGNVYGPGDTTGVKKERVIPTFIHKILKNEKIELFDGGKQRKQFIYIDDLVAALLHLIERYAVCDPVNIAGKEVVTIKQLSQVIKTLVIGEVPKNITFNREKSGKVISLSKAEKVILYMPKVSLIEGLRESVKYVTRI